MRIAALIFGVLAGLLGGGVIVYANLESGLAAAPLLASYGASNARVIVYLVPLLGLIGALLALFRPKSGAILLLLSAAGWAAEAFVVGHGAVLFAAVPFTFAAAAAVVAFSSRASDRPEREATAPVRSFEPDWDDEEEDDEPPFVPPPRQRSRREAPAAPTPPARPARAARPQRRPPIAPVPEIYDEDDYSPDDRYAPRRAAAAGRYAPDEEDAPDYIDAEETTGEPEWVEEAAYEEPDEPPEEQFYDEPEDQTFEDPRDPADHRPPPRRAGMRASSGEWSLPDPRQSPAPQRAQQRYAAEQTSARSIRSAPIAPPARPRAVTPRQPALDFDVPPDDLRPARRELRPHNVYREFEPAPADAPRNPSPMLRYLVLAAFLCVVGGLAAFVYIDYERGPDSLLFGSRPAATASQVEPAPPVAAPAPVAAQPQPTPVPLAANPPAAADPGPTSDISTPADASSPPVLQTADASAAPAQSYSNPFNYCRAVNSVDAPDNRYTGPAIPPSVAVAMGPGVPPVQVHWRCDSQQVLACNSKGGAACNLTPTVDDMLSYCAQHPGAQNIPAPNGSWACNGKRPVIPRDQKWPVDARGFYPGAWSLVSPPGTT